MRRSPRAGPAPPPAAPIVPAAPPGQSVMQPGATAWLQVALPVAGALGALVFVLANPRPIYIATGVLFALSALGAGAGMALQQRVSFRQQTRSARARSLDHREEVRRAAAAASLAQRADAGWRHPAPGSLLAVAASRRRLWERRPADPDFLELRAGLGTLPPAAPLRAGPGAPALAALDPVRAYAL